MSPAAGKNGNGPGAGASSGEAPARIIQMSKLPTEPASAIGVSETTTERPLGVVSGDHSAVGARHLISLCRCAV